MSEAIRDALEELPAPVGVYPAREVPHRERTALRPLELPYAGTPGSEGLIGNIIREVVGRKPNHDRAAMYVSLDQLRRRNVRSLLLVDDYSGSGDQLIKYVDSWAESPTIKSWLSYGFLRIHVLVLAASRNALERLHRHQFLTGVRYLEQAGNFDSAIWMDEERASIEDLCVRYAGKPGSALGYRGERGLLVLHHTVPNNLPGILWETKNRKPDWVPLFGGRVLTPEMQIELDDYRLETDPRRIAMIIRQEWLGDVAAIHPNPTVRIYLLLLGAVARGYRDPMRIANLLGLTREASLQTLAACRILGLLDGTNRLTGEGRRELRSARGRSRVARSAPPCDGSDAPYYPSSLRGADDV
jgi:hypothetical protein